MMAQIDSFKGIHQGKRLFIMASGPSLSDLDLSPLNRRIVMGLNRSSLIYPHDQYHVTMDHRLFEEFPDLLRQTPYLFTLVGRPWGIPLKLLGPEGFSWDLAEGIYSGYSVSYMALQIGVYMGFEEIFYLGLDLRHHKGHTHFFGSDFRSLTHEKTEYPRMLKMMNFGAKALSRTHIKVYNCSPISTLTCFPKISYQKAIAL
ncbi:MAG: hypothetical protein GWM98_25670 [Nitrospinaceae bacterium]|nr:hypothetical protein [Nitrospinaceae bacterium]NIR57243.1 hypothetical protein [Nitrospinaceae bacterium]NIS87691.1 hypothetical protein [Nitrospinaceae bacterium]NIT84557.1 hypothetical protein [Nitrospinaceae bacterium]NIU46743.1 hypothetical protein [Nitrospinaceae bacterium]